jgi:hypothetical protein
MYIVDLVETFKAKGKSGTGENASIALTIGLDHREVLRWVGDLNAMDEMMEWCLDNCTGKFSVYGSTRWYFTEERDAASFKLRFQ